MHNFHFLLFFFFGAVHTFNVSLKQSFFRFLFHPPPLLLSFFSLSLPNTTGLMEQSHKIWWIKVSLYIYIYIYIYIYRAYFPPNVSIRSAQEEISINNYKIRWCTLCTILVSTDLYCFDSDLGSQFLTMSMFVFACTKMMYQTQYAGMYKMYVSMELCIPLVH